jgi:hypothetical protein
VKIWTRVVVMRRLAEIEAADTEEKKNKQMQMGWFQVRVDA